MGDPESAESFRCSCGIEISGRATGESVQLEPGERQLVESIGPSRQGCGAFQHVLRGRVTLRCECNAPEAEEFGAQGSVLARVLGAGVVGDGADYVVPTAGEQVGLGAVGGDLGDPAVRPEFAE